MHKKVVMLVYDSTMDTYCYMSEQYTISYRALAYKTRIIRSMFVL